MANFNAIFAGCESFMEGDVEINNDVSVPANDGEAVAFGTDSGAFQLRDISTGAELGTIPNALFRPL